MTDAPPKTFPGFESFYQLVNLNDRDELILYLDDPKNETIDIYDIHDGSVVPTSPLKPSTVSGNAPKDILSASVILKIVKQEIISLLVEQENTGWSTYPIEVFDANAELLPNYVGLSVIQKCGTPSREQARIEKKTVSRRCI